MMKSVFGWNALWFQKASQQRTSDPWIILPTHIQSYIIITKNGKEKKNCVLHLVKNQLYSTLLYATLYSVISSSIVGQVNGVFIRLSVC